MQPIESTNGADMETIKRTSGYFEYDKKKKVMSSSLNKLGLTRFPSVLEIISIATGRIVRFEQDEKQAERNEYWDGEMMVYVTRDTDINRIEVVINAWGESYV
jgi:hypothetical protein